MFASSVPVGFRVFSGLFSVLLRAFHGFSRRILKTHPFKQTTRDDNVLARSELLSPVEACTLRVPQRPVQQWDYTVYIYVYIYIYLYT